MEGVDHLLQQHLYSLVARAAVAALGLHLRRQMTQNHRQLPHGLLQAVVAVVGERLRSLKLSRLARASLMTTVTPHHRIPQERQVQAEVLLVSQPPPTQRAVQEPEEDLE